MAGDLSCGFAVVNATDRPVYRWLTTIVEEALTTKINVRFTINVPASFVFKAESVTTAQ